MIEVHQNLITVKLTNKILALESEIMQMELKSNALSKENFEIKKKWGALEDKNSTVSNC